VEFVVFVVHPEQLVAGVVHDDIIDHACAVYDDRPVGAIQVAAFDLGARRLVNPEEKAKGTEGGERVCVCVHMSSCVLTLVFECTASCVCK
jgi:hypothetical protein